MWKMKCHQPEIRLQSLSSIFTKVVLFYIFYSISDLNECVLGMHGCDLTTSDCINTQGSYQCHCKTGFHETTEGLCIGKLNCDLTTADCINTQGSYDKTKAAIHDKTKGICIGKLFESCDLTTSDCINTQGSYQCHCNTGFHDTTEGFCMGKLLNQLLKTKYHWFKDGSSVIRSSNQWDFSYW